MPPFCFWFIEILQCTYNNTLFFLLLTLQKVLPLYVLSIIPQGGSIVIICLSLIFVGVIRLSPLNMSWVIALSAIFNTLWILIVLDNFNIVLWYLIIYSAHLVILLSCITSSSKMLTCYTIFSDLTVMSSLYIFILFLRIRGFPPFLGFCGKFPVIIMLLDNLVEQFSVLCALLIFSILIIYMYINFRFKNTMLRQNNTFNSYKTSGKQTRNRILFLTLLPLVILLM